MDRPEYHRFFDGSVYESFAGGIILLGGEGEGRCSRDFGAEVSGSGFAASVFDIWAMRDDGPPKKGGPVFLLFETQGLSVHGTS
jgi:hypothetical protein